MSGSILPSVKEPVAGEDGKISAAWYRLLATFERLIYGAVTTTGTGLTTIASGALAIADGGVTDAMLRDSRALSVVGNPLGVDGDAQDIVAGADGRVLQRAGGMLQFGYLQLAPFTVATVPSAANNPQVVIYVSNEAGGATMAVSDGTNWRRMQDRAIIS